MSLDKNDPVLQKWINTTTDAIGTLAITDSPSEEMMKELLEEYYDIRSKKESVYNKPENPLMFLDHNEVHFDGEQNKGVTLRDYFAAKAMHALLVGDGTTNFDTRAKEAYEVADAMLKERYTILIAPECILHKRDGCKECFPKPEFPEDRIGSHV